MYPENSSKYWSKEFETMNKNDRNEWIVKKLKYLLKYVYQNSLYYHKLFDTVRLDIDSIRSLEDFSAKVPVTTKAIIRQQQHEHPPFGGFLCSSNISFMMASSGTTGKPTYIPFSREELERFGEYHARIMWSFGIRPGMGILIAAMFTLYAGAWGVFFGSNKLNLKIYPIGAGSPGSASNAVRAAQDLKPEVLYGTPSFIMHLLERAQEMGVNPEKDFNFKIVFGSGEPGLSLPQIKKKIKSIVGHDVKVIDTGSMVEAMPWMTNAECEYETGMHLWLDIVYTELVDPEDTHLLNFGEEGVLTYTSLERQVYPLIRYFSGDVSYWIDDPCECGRTYPRLPKGIYGRIDDMIVIKGVKTWPSVIQEILEKTPYYNGEFRVVLGQKESREYLKLVIEINEDAMRMIQNDESFEERITEELRRALKYGLGVSAEIELAKPFSLERSIHKSKRIVDERAISAELSKLRLHGGN